MQWDNGGRGGTQTHTHTYTHTQVQKVDGTGQLLLEHRLSCWELLLDLELFEPSVQLTRGEWQA